MIKLESNALLPIEPANGALDMVPGVFRLAECMEISAPGCKDEIFIARGSSAIPSGFAGYFFFDTPIGQAPANSFIVEPALSYLRAGDIVRIHPSRKALRVLYRAESLHNFFLLTERCNNFCLMCSQPPKKADDSHLVDDVLRAIPMMDPKTQSLGLTGGEPTLLGQRLVQVIDALKRFLPSTAVHILSNGRAFKDLTFASSISAIKHQDLMFGIPLYSDVDSIHDYVVQAEGAYDDTIRGILNLKSVGVQVEIRVVVHKLTYERLPDLAQFIRRNLTFCDHVALMGLEMAGFTKINLDKLWIDPWDYRQQLRSAVEILSAAKIRVSIYNHQLCLLDPSVMPFSVRSISDWKNEYMPECGGCLKNVECGGFFSSASVRYSSHIKAFRHL